MNLPTRTDIATKISNYILANSPLTSIGPFSALQGITNAVAATIEDFYRDIVVQMVINGQQGVYSVFDFAQLSPTSAQATLSLSGTPGSVIPQGTLFSNTGSTGSPAIQFQSTAVTYLLAANPTVAPTLTQSAGTSTLTNGTTYYVNYAWTSSYVTGSTLVSPTSNITMSAANQQINLTLTLPTGATGVNIYIGTPTSPLLLGNITSTGTITYSGSAVSGLSVTVVGSQLTIAITAPANGGSSAPLASAAGTATVSATAVAAGSAGNVGAGAITNIVTPVSGLVTVYNNNAASGGTDLESLASQQQRFTVYINSLSRATLAALETAALTVPGVLKANAVDRAYLTVFTNQSSTWTDVSIEANYPKGVPINPFPSTLAIGNAIYIGADRRFENLYFDVSTSGSGLSASWQYLNSAGTWTSLTTTTDQTNNGQLSGTVAWNLPADWTSQIVNSSSNLFWVRLYVTSATVTTIPQYYQIMTNDPPPGYVNLWVYQQAGAVNVLSNLQSTLSSWRGAGITVISNNCNTQTVNVTVNIIPTTYGQTVPLVTAATSAITNLFSNLAIGQELSISSIYYAIANLYAGQATMEIDITAPTADVLPGQDTLLLAGTITVNLISQPT